MNNFDALTDEQIIRSFSCYSGPALPGYLIDFLGAKTRTSYLSVLPPEGGIVESYPIPESFHAPALEWAGVLRAVLEASGEIVAVELGAGWGPWLMTVAQAARQKGIERVRLMGVEGSREHCEFMRSHFEDNGLDPARHSIIHGVVGSKNGTAEFRLLPDPAADWGASALSRGTPRAWARRLKSAARSAARFALTLVGRKNAWPPLTEKVRCYSLPTLLRPYPHIHLIHIDIQGDEYKVVRSARRTLKQKVRRLVIGTHGRRIEQILLEELAAQGWKLEAEKSCGYRQDARHVRLDQDGCQVWRNIVFDAKSGQSGRKT